MADLAEIEKQTQKYSEARDQLAELVSSLKAGIDALKKDSLLGIKKAIKRAAEHHDRLRAMIEESPELFVRPKSKVLHGIKIGYQKGRGKIEIDDADKVIRLIKKHLPDQADVLIQTKEEVSRNALKNLSDEELKKLGIKVQTVGDVIVISAIDGDVDKLVNELLKAATEEPDAA